MKMVLQYHNILSVEYILTYMCIYGYKNSKEVKKLKIL